MLDPRELLSGITIQNPFNTTQVGNQTVFHILFDAAVWRIRTWEELKSMSYFTMLNYGNFIAIIFTAVFAVFQASRQIKKMKTAQGRATFLPAPGFPEIEPLHDFDWQKTEPIKIRPFKPKYHLTMALENLSPSELTLMDDTYLDRIKYRRGILKDKSKRPETINIDEKSRVAILPAIAELYTWLFTHYLPIRYQSMFKLHKTDYEYGSEFMLENKVTGNLIPARAIGGDGVPLTAERMLETIAEMVDEDFLFLIPEDSVTDDIPDVQPYWISKKDTQSSPSDSTLRERKPTSASSSTTTNSTATTSSSSTSTSEPNPPAPSTPPTSYLLAAYTTICPNGFRPSEKLGLPLRAIHGPVPGYEDKLAGSMDRFFNKIEPGKYVKRANWSIMTGAVELFAAPMPSEEDEKKNGGVMHAYEGEEVEEMKELDVEKTFVRCERQTLHRLPHSKALVFSFKTYIYPITEIKSEPESASALADAVDGLKKGNVPQMHFYKRGAVWGEALKKYLRS